MYFVILIVLFLAFFVYQLFLKAKVVHKRLPTVPKFDGSKPFLWKNFIKTWEIFERCVGEEAAEVIFFNEALSGAALDYVIGLDRRAAIKFLAGIFENKSSVSRWIREDARNLSLVKDELDHSNILGALSKIRSWNNLLPESTVSVVGLSAVLRDKFPVAWLAEISEGEEINIRKLAYILERREFGARPFASIVESSINAINSQQWASSSNGKFGQRKEIRCFSCGKLGHIAKKCWSKNKSRLEGKEVSGEQAVKQVVESEQSVAESLIKHVDNYVFGVNGCYHDQPFIVFAVVDGQKIRMLVDTGAAISILPLRTFPNSLPASKVFKGAFGHKAEAFGPWSRDMVIAGNHFLLEAYSADLNENVGILGRDFLVKYKVSWNAESGELVASLNGQNVVLKQSRVRTKTNSIFAIWTGQDLIDEMEQFRISEDSGRVSEGMASLFQKYEHLFSGVGHYNGVQHFIPLLDDATPLNVDADALSRLVALIEVDDADPELMRMVNAKPNQFVLEDGHWLFVGDGGRRRAIPPGLRERVLELVHDKNSHFGVEKTWNVVKERFYYN
ncbi:hypothetical protein HUG17_1209 [Dermatophagoides farinae]|uniref:RNA-directed DNA polymerase n=1 Tax=Dermatophagoides farinae TaxID=6954 RepID=A0A9D4P6I1_DERFA|nr:hypothetical protein HUG17_1209 [Dermatophagoides farinae]